MKHKLTPAFVAKPPLLEPGRDRITYWEGNFGLMVTAKGHKSFVVQYRVGKVSRRMSLKAGLSLQEARREAKAILGAVAKGGDPLGEKRKAIMRTAVAAARSGVGTMRASSCSPSRLKMTSNSAFGSGRATMCLPASAPRRHPQDDLTPRGDSHILYARSSLLPGN
jgi:hypothetical protein